MNNANNGTSPSPATLVLATCNTLNLALPGHAFYPNQEPFAADEYQRKVEWLGSMRTRLAETDRTLALCSTCSQQGEEYQPSLRQSNEQRTAHEAGSAGHTLARC
jgi:hypothetical protein